MMRTVLFVDDEGFFAKPYRMELEKKFTVLYRDSAQDALAALQEHAEIAAVVLDVMMPTPDGVAETATSYGLDTGLWLLRQITPRIAAQPLPVVILTNRSRSLVQDTITEIHLPAGLVEVKTKPETPSFFLPHVVETILERCHRPAAASH